MFCSLINCNIFWLLRQPGRSANKRNQVTSPSSYRSTVPTSYQTLVLISFTQDGRCRKCAGIRRVSSCVSLKLALPIQFQVNHLLWFTLYMLYLPTIWRHTVCTCAVCVTAWLPTVLANTDRRTEKWPLQGQSDIFVVFVMWVYF